MWLFNILLLTYIQSRVSWFVMFLDLIKTRCVSLASWMFFPHKAMPLILSSAGWKWYYLILSNSSNISRIFCSSGRQAWKRLLTIAGIAIAGITYKTPDSLGSMYFIYFQCYARTLLTKRDTSLLFYFHIWQQSMECNMFSTKIISVL